MDASSCHKALVRRIARSSWRVDRAARKQENTMAHEVVTLEQIETSERRKVIGRDRQEFESL